ARSLDVRAPHRIRTGGLLASRVSQGGLLAAATVAAVTVTTTPAQAQFELLFGGISRPAPGVVCDRSAMTCFNRRGPSVDLTRQHLGNSAAQRLSASLSGRPPAREFRLSNGVVCSVPEQTCWTNASRSRVNDSFTRDLFAAASSDGPAATKTAGICSLTQRGRALYDGPCDLRIVSREAGDISRYSVSTDDGRRFVFRKRGDTLQLEDATGTWPVDYRSHGRTGVFRWGDMKLVATRDPDSVVDPQRPQAPSLGDLIDRLFFGGSD
ncbi:MAG: hypothetical protein AB1Z21_07390, partial [Synechococcaceae cyanobacterium]